MKSVLMVAEKPSLALSIAKILSNGHCTSRKGISPPCPVHEYNGTFRGQAVKFKMTSVCGHVMTLDFKAEFNNWDAVDPEVLFSADARKKEAAPELHIPKFLEHEARGIDYLVLWLDCDKEGENICFEVLECVDTAMRKSFSGEQTVFRARFSSITDQDIRHAMANLVSPNENEARSVDARQELDLRIGCAFTRFQTRYFQGKYGNLDSSLISYGPCQTPTLGFCVNRHDQIQSFKPETFWKIQATVKHGSGQEVDLDWGRVRVFDQEIANMFMNIVKGCAAARVVDITEKEKAKQRPQALNTVELLRVCSSGLGISPQQTMHIAEKLYTQGYISYPRTETTSYAENFDLHGTLRQQANSSVWGDCVRDLLALGINRPRKGTDVGDHPPITPTRGASPSELTGDSWRVYDYIVRHFIGSLSYDCKYQQTTVEFVVNGEAFSCEGKTLLSPGFTAAMSWAAIPAEESLPTFRVNSECEIVSIKLLERQTSPPDYLTESELISLMEKHGIGTDASIPVHINNICQRNYVTVAGNRRLVPTPLGVVLVHGYQKIDPQLVQSTMRAAVEKQLNLIAHGQADFYAVLRHAIGIFEAKFKYFVRTIENMDELFEVSFTKLSESGRPLSRCGKCFRYMKYIEAKPYRLYCSHCDETYSLPQNGCVKVYKELKCPIDEFELVLWSKGGKSKSFPLCPSCYSNPPFEGMRKNMGCNQCTHPTCKHGFTELSVSDCPECDDEAGGVLVLEPFSGPKWRLSCNKCNVVISVCEDAFKISIADEECECGASLLDIDFNKAKSPLTDGSTKHIGCAFCDPILEPMVFFISGPRKGAYQAQRANQAEPQPAAENDGAYGDGTRGRGTERGRGRGRGHGRGRGRGRRRGRGRGRGGMRGSGRRRGGSESDDDVIDPAYARPKSGHSLGDFLKF